MIGYSISLVQHHHPVSSAPEQPISEPQILGLPQSASQISIVGQNETTIVISDAASADGTYVVPHAELLAGPVNLVRNRAEGSGLVGEALTGTPGIWAYVGTLPVLSYQWYRDDVALTGATALNYVPVSGDAGAGLVLRETATGSHGTRFALSEALTITEPSAGVGIALLGEGQVEMTADENGDLLVTISDVTAPASYNGTYTVSPADLASGPVNLVSPGLTGDADPAAGETLVITPGLWIYDGDTAAPTITYSHDGAGVISGMGYAIAAGDAGRTVVVTEQAAGAAGTRMAASNGVTIPAAATTFTDDFESYAAGVELEDQPGWTSVKAQGRVIVYQAGSSKVVRPQGTNLFQLLSADITLANDQFAEMTLLTAGNSNAAIAAVVVRLTGSGDYYRAIVQNAKLYMSKYVGGAFTNLGSAGNVVNGDTIRLEASGTTIRALVNGVQRRSVSDGSHTGGQAGLYAQAGAGVSEWADIETFTCGEL